jgi:hypothetical protein
MVYFYYYYNFISKYYCTCEGILAYKTITVRLWKLCCPFMGIYCHELTDEENFF